ncbi:leucine-rich repeat receptor-like serine/threonine-protein kinase At1g17230 [Ipomoea triloba]|uniref:leucine-rich repeat receptor-like serine/threonine-protein kinase At1g17230 n=1 Tax=Ipomoea triloba TaxID=35885 RepID=UPI00125E175A|nr:leucine-rich repeat receptor-like serine/threonine-protein kinase At1g17230 [Ipomoea triloba]
MNEKIDVYSFSVIILELVTGRESNDGNMDWCLVDWVRYYVQEGKPIEDALDEEIKEAENIDEMCGVFRLGIFCTGANPAKRPSMREVLRFLLDCSSQSANGKEMSVSERDVSPLLKCSSSEGILEDGDDGLKPANDSSIKISLPFILYVKLVMVSEPMRSSYAAAVSGVGDTIPGTRTTTPITRSSIHNPVRNSPERIPQQNPQ